MFYGADQNPALYYDTLPGDTDHWLLDNFHQPVVSGPSWGTHYTSTGGGGLSGVPTGVTDYDYFTGGYADGNQGFRMANPHGILSLVFDEVDATHISVWLYIQETGWEGNDFISVTFGDQEIFYASNDGMEELEGGWFEVSAEVSGVGALTISMESQWNSESVYVDDVHITTVPAPAGLAALVLAGWFGHRRRR